VYHPAWTIQNTIPETTTAAGFTRLMLFSWGAARAGMRAF
jgi:hypothetical protein